MMKKVHKRIIMGIIITQILVVMLIYFFDTEDKFINQLENNLVTVKQSPMSKN